MGGPIRSYTFANTEDLFGLLYTVYLTELGSHSRAAAIAIRNGVLQLMTDFPTPGPVQQAWTEVSRPTTLDGGYTKNVESSYLGVSDLPVWGVLTQRMCIILYHSVYHFRREGGLFLYFYKPHTKLNPVIYSCISFLSRRRSAPLSYQATLNRQG